MTNRPFDQQVIPVLQRPTSNDLNIGLSLLYYSMMFMQEVTSRTNSDPAVATPTAAPSGFIGASFMARATGSDMTITLANGLGFIYNASDIQAAVTPASGQTVVGVSDLSAVKPVVLKADATFTAPAADPSSDRYDIIECRIDRHYADSTVLDFFDTGTEQFVPGPAFKTFSRGELDTQTGYNLVYSADSTAGLSYKVGQVGAGVPPSTSTGYVRIAIIKVAAAATTIPANAVDDRRYLIAPGMAQRVSLRARSTGGGGGLGQIGILGGRLPPGVRVTTRLLGSSPAYWRFYVFAGAGAGFANVNVTPAFQNAGDAMKDSVVGHTLNSTTAANVDLSLQTALAGGDATVFPTLDVAIGQPYTYVDVVLKTFNSAAVPPQFTQGLFPDPFDFFVGFDLWVL